jgi:nitroreductase
VSDLGDVVLRRRMTRSFSTRPVPPGVVDALVELATRAPSAGKSQGWHAVVLEGEETERFWRHAFPSERRAGFAWPQLFDAPVVLLVLADPGAYVARYSEPDKTATGLGAGPEAWPTPYWTVDAGMASMLVLLAAEDVGLGALFFAVFSGEAEVRAELGIPADLQMIGAIALGYRSEDASSPGVSARRPRRTAHEVIHRGRW